MRRKKKLYICLSAIAAVLVLAVPTVTLLTGNRLEASAVSGKTDNAASDETFTPVSEGEIVLENDRVRFVLDAKTTHFTVSDKGAGSAFASYASAAAEGSDGLYFSELAIDYYNADGLQKSLYSTDNSVRFGSYTVEKSNNAVRVTYDIRESETDIFVPSVFTKETFEEEILGKLNVGQKRRIIRYYKLRSAEENADLVSAYPELKKQDLYIVIDSMNAKDQTEVTEYFNAVGYTAEKYAADTAEMDITETEIDVPAKFHVPVEYRITKDGFTSAVLSDRITSASEKHTLTNVHLLPLFGSVAEVRDGYLFIPDGSGALMSIAERSNQRLNVKIYGADASVDKEQNTQITQSAVMPVFGMNRKDSGFFAVIESAAECATVCGRVLGDSNLSSMVYPSFLVRSVDETDIAAYSSVTSFSLYAKKAVTDPLTVRYILLDDQNCDYSSMAKTYRAYLTEKGVFDRRLTDGTPLYLDFTGYVTTDASFLGIPYGAKTVLSTVDGMDKAVDALQADGVTDLSVRLKGYSHNGMQNAMVDSFKPVSDVGSTKALQALAAKLQQNGNLLYVDDPIDIVYKDGSFDRFSKLTHAAKKINRMVVKRGFLDPVFLAKDRLIGSYYLLSPRYYEALTDAFVTAFEKKMGSPADYGYAWAGYGSRLIGDYQASDTIDRAEARRMADNAAARAESFGSLMTEGGNMYAVARADTLLKIPLSDSSYRVVTEKVPFYAMVLHGYRSYAGAALNLASDAETAWLNTIESGASMYYSCMTEPYTVVKNLARQQMLYPIAETLSHKEIVDRYTAWAPTFERLSTQLIERHETTPEGIHLTVYEDGTVIAVNYGTKALTWNNVTVEPRNFAVVQQEKMP